MEALLPRPLILSQLDKQSIRESFQNVSNHFKIVAMRDCIREKALRDRSYRPHVHSGWRESFGGPLSGNAGCPLCLNGIFELQKRFLELSFQNRIRAIQTAARELANASLVVE